MIDFRGRVLAAHPRAKRLLGLLVLGICLVGNLWLVLYPDASESSQSAKLEALEVRHAAEHHQRRALEGPGVETTSASVSDFQAVVPVSEEDYLPDRLVKHRPKPIASPRSSLTVKAAAARSCSTSSVEGLSKQIIAQSRCIDPDAFVRVPDRSNLKTRSGVFLYLTAPARSNFLAALDASPQQTLVVNSALRTLAQQYLLSRWGSDNRCGIRMAAAPGKSNHESGLALDISHPEKFRSTLEAHGFKWLGAKDPVHFDYIGKGAVARNAVDVMAFQQLWNRNHPDDPLRANGRYTAKTEQRLVESPASGFPKGAHCGG